MSVRRSTDGDASRTVFRSERLVQEGGKWYFHTREGSLEGPFADQVEALRMLDAYINVKASGKTFVRELNLVPMAG